MINLSIIIISYNTKDTTLNCLKHLFDSNLNKFRIELIIIDNASRDNSPKAIETFLKNNRNKNINPILVKNNQNLGFSKANNKGIKFAQGKYILLLNSDVIVNKTSIIDQLDFMEKNPKFSISTCKISLSNKQIDPACHRGFPTPWASFTYFSKLEKLFPKSDLFSQYHQGWKDFSKIHEVDVISGAFFFTRKEIFDQIGMFDENFFMYGEDIDLCFRIKEKGLKIGYNPNTTALHLKGRSGRKKNDSKTNKHFWETMKLFYQKHYETKYPKFLQTLIFKFIDYKMKN